MSRKSKAEKRQQEVSKKVLANAKHERIADLGVEPAPEGSTKMRFKEDKYYKDLNKPFYTKGVLYDVPNNMVERWLKRGGVIIDCPETLELVEKSEKEELEKAQQDLEAEEKKVEDQGEPKFIDPVGDDADSDGTDEGYF